MVIDWINGVGIFKIDFVFINFGYLLIVDFVVCYFGIIGCMLVKWVLLYWEWKFLWLIGCSWCFCGK